MRDDRPRFRYSETRGFETNNPEATELALSLWHNRNRRKQGFITTIEFYFYDQFGHIKLSETQPVECIL